MNYLGANEREQARITANDRDDRDDGTQAGDREHGRGQLSGCSRFREEVGVAEQGSAVEAMTFGADDGVVEFA